MENRILAPEYAFNVERGIWSREGYVGIRYNDGDEVERRLAAIIDDASDITVFSPELQAKCTDWPSLYHLSSTRANILRPFAGELAGDVLEVGAGCGAITRYLGESAARILALEGSFRRAGIVRSRTRDLKNVTVLAEKFDQFQSNQQFDLITLIGVLEYANLFTSGENPPLAMLQRARSLLKPEGKLIIAIENQLGLKYFAGAPEDHIGRPMYGIEGRYEPDQPKTFGRAVLEELLIETGFCTTEFLAPFPDYKLPVSILTEEGLNNSQFGGAVLAWQSVKRDPQLSANLNFSLELAWPEIFKNRLALDLANSFLVMASLSAQKVTKPGILGYHYSTDRAVEYRKETIFQRDDKRITVNYHLLHTKHEYSSKTSTEINRIVNFVCLEETAYTEGKPLWFEFVKIVSRDGWLIEEVGFFIRRYVDVISTIVKRKECSIELCQLTDKLPGYFFDLTPQNIIINQTEQPVPINTEWSLKGDIELGLLLFRSLLWSTASVFFGENSSGKQFSRREFIKSALALAGFRVTDDDFKRFIELEAIVQLQVTGYLPQDFLNRGLDQKLPVRMAGHDDKQTVHLKEKLSKLEEKITYLEHSLAIRDEQITAFYRSTSWRITSPLRSAIRHLKRVRRIAPLPDRAALRSVKSYISHYSIRQQVRSTYFFARGISMRIVHPVSPKLHELLFVKLAPFLKRKLLRSLLFSFDPKKLYQNRHQCVGDFRPKVSVIVPSYNHACFLRQRLDSIYQQRYSNIDVILLDDASTDESQEILEEYRQRYPQVTKCAFNKENSGSAFNQWQRGFELATGDLVWIAESDDYCSENFLEDLIKCFVNEAVILAYCRSVFVEGASAKPVWSLEEYLAEVDANLWHKPFVMSAHHLVNKAWAMKNIVPNVSSAVFRHPGKLELLDDNTWKQMRICGDWIFYLHLVRGGLIAYTPKATNYYRLHENNTSRNTYSSDIYYREHELVAKELLSLYRVDRDVLQRQQQVLQFQWRTFRIDYSEDSFGSCYNFERIQYLATQRKPNVLMASFALTAGGGETFPIKLANMLKATGYGVTFLNCGKAPTEAGVRAMLRKDIPLLEVDSLEKLGTVIDDMGIEIIHSHHGWVDANICHFLKPDSNAKLIVTTHGMYETVTPVELAQVLPLLKKRVSKFIYLSDKNLAPFISHGFDTDGFVRIDNAVDISPIMPVPRSELGVPEDAFLICVVSRAIPEKGWQEGIEAVKLARRISGKDIHLLLIGAGPEYDRLTPVVKDSFIHFLGFRPNTRDYFAASDLGFLPSRFTGESFPLVLIECLHSNRPMLASNVGEIKNMLATGKGTAGAVFNLENQNIPIAGVAEMIAAYAEKTDFYLGHLQCVPEAARKFDPAIMLRRYEKVYLEVLEGTSGSEGNVAEVEKRDPLLEISI